MRFRIIMNSGQDLTADLPVSDISEVINHMLGPNPTYSNWFHPGTGMIIKVDNICTIERYK